MSNNISDTEKVVVLEFHGTLCNSLLLSMIFSIGRFIYIMVLYIFVKVIYYFRVYLRSNIKKNANKETHLPRIIYS